MLYEWDLVATAAIIGATRDEVWRVREMAVKVIAGQQVGDALDAVAAGRADEVARVRADEVARVRAAASRAVTALTAAGA